MLQFVISVCGVVVFTGLTMYDAQKLKQMALVLPDGRTGSYAVVGALSLYLDFINLFLYLLRFILVVKALLILLMLGITAIFLSNHFRTIIRI